MSSRHVVIGAAGRRLALVGSWAAAVLAIGLVSTSPAQAARALPVAAVAGEHQLGTGEAMYPRVVRLQHSGSLNGRLIASVSAPSSTGGVTDVARLFESIDDGASFHPLSSIADPQADAGRGSCCASLYELPAQVGTQPAGTLLFAMTVGMIYKTGRRPEIRVWASHDGGATWSYLSSCASAPGAPADRGLWEPELAIDARGDLDCYFSDDSGSTTGSHSGFDQFLAMVTSTDGGRTWGPRQNVVAIPSTSPVTYRPGMANVRRLPNGRYLMSYELCGSGLPDWCAVYYRTSADGWRWGDPADPGTVPETVDGKRLFHAPTIAWAPGGGPNGRILLIGDLVKDASGQILRPASGSTIFANTENGGNVAGGVSRWYELDAPVTVGFSARPDQTEIVCSNYSSSLLPSADGATVLEIATRRVTGGACQAFFATGPAGGTGDAAGVVSGRTYRLGSVQSGLCLDVPSKSTAAGVRLRQRSCNGANAQGWTLRARGAGSFTLTNAGSGKCLDVPSSSKSPGVQVQQWSCNGTKAQLWRAENAGRSAYRFVSRASGLCLDVAGGSLTQGAAVQQWTCNGLSPQIWTLG